jgi:hypothetical protein
MDLAFVGGVVVDRFLIDFHLTNFLRRVFVQKTQSVSFPIPPADAA